MGVISRQSIKSSLVSYVGIGLGTLNMVFIYSLDDFNTFGFLQILITASLLLSPIFTLGVRGVILRFFPYFKDTPEQRAAFLSFAILTGFCGITVLGLVGNFVILPLLDQFESSENNVQVYIRFAYYIYCITAIQILIEILDFYIQNFRRVTVQTIFTNLLPKLTMGALVFLTYKFGFDLEIVAITVVGMNLVILLCLLAYLNHLKELRLTWKIGIHFSPRMRREIFDFALFAILGTLGNKLVLQIDTISLGTLTDEQTVGIFRFVAFAAGVIDIPLRAMMRITSPVVSQHMSDQNYHEVNDIYKRSASVLAFTGFTVFTAIWVVLPSVFEFMGNSNLFDGAIVCFLLLGGAKLVNMVTSINNQIIVYSRLYRYNHYLLLLLAIANVYLNWLFISSFNLGLIGAALATFVSLTVYNILRCTLVYVKFKIHPFSFGMLVLLGFSICLGVSLSFLDIEVHPIIRGILYGGLTALVFLLTALYSNLFPDIKSEIIKQYKKL